MTKKGKYIVKIQEFVLKTILFFICLFALSSSATNINSDDYNCSNDTDSNISSENKCSTFHSYNHNSDFSYHSCQSPIEPNPNSNESKDNDEKENLDDDDYNKPHFYFESDLNVFKSANNTFAQFQQTVLNRTTVSLIILYHSWKDYFSIS